MEHVKTLQAEICALYQGMDTLVEQFSFVVLVQLLQLETRL